MVCRLLGGQPDYCLILDEGRGRERRGGGIVKGITWGEDVNMYRGRGRD